MAPYQADSEIWLIREVWLHTDHKRCNQTVKTCEFHRHQSSRCTLMVVTGDFFLNSSFYFLSTVGEVEGHIYVNL